jgi:hypothetical protein
MSALTKAEAQRRVEEALHLLQQAQDITGHALALLSSLSGGLPAWNFANKTYDRIRATWYRVAKLRGSARVDLDGVSGPVFEAKAAERTR